MSNPLISASAKADDFLSLFWSFSSSFKTAKSVRIDRDLISSPVCDNLRHLCHEIPFLVIFWSQLDRIHWIPKIKISILSHSWLIKHILHFFRTHSAPMKRVRKRLFGKWIKNWTTCWAHLLRYEGSSYSKGWKTHLPRLQCNRCMDGVDNAVGQASKKFKLHQGHLS